MFRFQQLTGRQAGAAPSSSANTMIPFGRGQPSSMSTTSISTTSRGSGNSSSNNTSVKKQRPVGKLSPPPDTMFINSVHHVPMSVDISSASLSTVEPTTNKTELSTPTEYAKHLLPLGNENVDKSAGMDAAKEKYKFVQPSDELLDSYTIEAVNTVRSNDVNKMQTLLDVGQNFNACNRNGETLLHMACRCCTVEIVQFLITIAKVNVNVIDSVGRNVLHDICWRHRLDVDMMMIFVDIISPYMFLMCDNRGHTCFDYCRKEHYDIWIEFLKENAFKIVERSRKGVCQADIVDLDQDNRIEITTSETEIVDKYKIKISTTDHNGSNNVETQEKALAFAVSSLTSRCSRLNYRSTSLAQAEGVPPNMDVVTTISNTKALKSKRSGALKRKDSSSLLETSFSTFATDVVDLTSSSCSTSRTASPVPTRTNANNWLAAVKFDDDTSLMNGPLRKKSNSSANLQELRQQEELLLQESRGNVVLIEQQQASQLRRVQSAVCPLATLAAVAVAVSQMETPQNTSASSNVANEHNVV